MHSRCRAVNGSCPTTPRARRDSLYLHGGGYYFCSPRSHLAIAFGLATRAHAGVFSLDYRLAPEHRFPAALDDAPAAYHALLAKGIGSEAVVIAGDPLPAGAILFSPWTDLTCSGASMRTNEGRDPMYHASAFPKVAALYLGRRRRCGASLRTAALRRFHPPAAASDSDGRQRTAARRFDARRRQGTRGGCLADLRIWPKVPHIFPIWAPFMPEAREALDDAARFIARMTA